MEVEAAEVEVMNTGLDAFVGLAPRCKDWQMDLATKVALNRIDHIDSGIGCSHRCNVAVALRRPLVYSETLV